MCTFFSSLFYFWGSVSIEYNKGNQYLQVQIFLINKTVQMDQMNFVNRLKLQSGSDLYLLPLVLVLDVADGGAQLCEHGDRDLVLVRQHVSHAT